MKREEIIEMARQTLLASWHKDLKKWQIEQGIEAFAKLVAAKEREACAKVCDELSKKHSWEGCYANECAEEIRAR